MRKESILEHLLTVEPALEGILSTGNGDEVIIAERELGVSAIRSMLKYCVNTRHVTRLKRMVSFSPNEESIILPIRQEGKVIINLTDFSIKIHWPKTRVTILINDFTSNKGILDCSSYKGYKVPVEINPLFLDKTVYNQIWMICSNGLSGNYTPDLLDSSDFNFGRLANLLYMGNFGASYLRSVSFVTPEGCRITLSTMNKYRREDKRIISKPFLYIENVEEQFNGHWVTFDSWTRNVVLIEDLLENMSSYVFRLLKQHNQELKHSSNFVKDPVCLNGYY